MKILFVASNLQALGGIQAYNRKLLGALRDFGVRVDTVEAKNTSPLQKAVFSAKFFIKAIFGRPKIIMLTNLNYGPLGLAAKRFLGIPFTVSVYGIEVKDIKTPIYLRTLREAKYIIKLFEETARNVLRQVPEARDKILTIPNSVDGSRFDVRQKRDDFIDQFGLKDKKIILTIGRMSKLDGDNKGYKRVIRAMPEVISSVPNAIYLLAGSGDDIPDTQKLIGDLNLKDKVILSGPVKDENMADFYNLGDVFALPSKNEGFPAIVLLESLACGTPVLGGAQPGAKEEFDGKYGLIVEPDNISEVAEGLIKILKGDVNQNIKNRIWLRNTVLEEYGRDAYRAAVKKAVDALQK